MPSPLSTLRILVLLVVAGGCAMDFRDEASCGSGVTFSVTETSIDGVTPIALDCGRSAEQDGSVTFQAGTGFWDNDTVSLRNVDATTPAVWLTIVDPVEGQSYPLLDRPGDAPRSATLAYYGAAGQDCSFFDRNQRNAELTLTVDRLTESGIEGRIEGSFYCSNVSLNNDLRQWPNGRFQVRF